jgi:hypothetical protein
MTTLEKGYDYIKNLEERKGDIIMTRNQRASLAWELDRRADELERMKQCIADVMNGYHTYDSGQQKAIMRPEQDRCATPSVWDKVRSWRFASN